MPVLMVSNWKPFGDSTAVGENPKILFWGIMMIICAVVLFKRCFVCVPGSLGFDPQHHGDCAGFGEAPSAG